jgi:prolyl 4-hydroxylase
MRRSTVVGPHGESVIDNYRSSYGMFIRRMYDPVITSIEERIARLTHLNISHQVLFKKRNVLLGSF